MNIKHTLLITLISVFMTGCASKQYKYSPQNSQDPTIEFTSDYDKSTRFLIAKDSTTCSNYSHVGTINKVGSGLWGDKTLKEIQVHVPANKKVIVRASYNGRVGQYLHSCGPIIKSFIPLKGVQYKVNMESTYNNGCSLIISLKDKQNSAWRVQQTNSEKNCSLF